MERESEENRRLSILLDNGAGDLRGERRVSASSAW